MQQSPVAFFDIDGTLFRSSLLIELVEALVHEGIFPADTPALYEPALQAWLQREGTYEAYIQMVISAFMSNIKGVSYDTFTTIGGEVVAKNSKRVYQFTRDYIKELKENGYTVIAISQSPKLILDNFCAAYGFDKVYGRMYAVDESNHFTGETIDERIIENKANIVERVFERHPELTSEHSIAVGDTEGDIPLLSQVAQPVCFNPNRVLYDHATSHGWRIVVERKDVVYHL